jgi:hydroxyethylthiazole kinase-like uncharacterized protein yjeF
MENLTSNIINSLIKPRKATSHKGDYGHSFLIVGSEGKMGAAVIAARACLRTGTGLLTVSVPKEERLVLQIAIPEAMLVMREKDEDNLRNFSALGIGCGIGVEKESIQTLSYILYELTKPIVLDADALNIISVHRHLMDKIPPNTIITPHPKEFDRLFGVHRSSEGRINTAINKAIHYQIIIVLKGHKTCITNGQEVWINTTGNAGLAKGGSGDALTGIITALLSQGYLPFEAAKIGVYIHGLAADLALEKQSTESLLITDVIEYLGEAFKVITCE